MENNVRVNEEAVYTLRRPLTVYLVGYPYVAPDGSKTGFYCPHNRELFEYGKPYDYYSRVAFINKADALELANYRWDDNTWVDGEAHIARCTIRYNVVVKFGYLANHSIISIPNVVVTPELEVLCVDNSIPVMPEYLEQLKEATKEMPLQQEFFEG